MDVVLNFLPLKSGGGLQVGLDFAAQARAAQTPHRWFLVATAGTPFAALEETDHFQLAKLVPRGLGARVSFEAFGCRTLLRTIRPALVYTQFGPQWLGAGRVTNVVGCAYSNLCYPEIDFWGRLPPAQRRVRLAIDHWRRNRVRKADAVIFETDDLARRAIRHLRLDPQRVHVVRPSVSSLVNDRCSDAATRSRCATLPSGFKVLLLSVYNPNKNFELLPHIARALHVRSKANDVMFVVTLPLASRAWSSLSSTARALGVADRLFNFGPVPQHGCADLYRACDAVILPSQLESFSNTIAESWAMQRPLLIADLPWARALCGKAASYFTYDDAESAADRVQELIDDSRLRTARAMAGQRELARYPTSEQRFRQYVAVLERHAKH